MLCKPGDIHEAGGGSERIASGSDYGNPTPRWPEIDWRRHLHRVVPGSVVNYVEIGAGEPILFVHGISGCWRNWLENLPYFAERRRAIALDLPGFGSTPMPSWEIGVAAHWRLIHDFCEKLGVEGPAAIVGHSMGGLIAAEAVTQAPGRFDRLALVAAAGILNASNPERWASAAAFAWKTLGPAFADHARELLARPRVRQAVAGPVVRYPARLRADLLWEQMEGGLRCPVFAEALRALIRHDIRARLADIEIPTRIVWGFDDRVIGVEAALSYHRRIPAQGLRSLSARATPPSSSARAGSMPCSRSCLPANR